MVNYIQKAKKRKKAKIEKKRKALKSEAYRLVELLKKRDFKFEKLFLFGSVISEKPLGPWSDIDLVVKGLNSKNYYKMYSFLLQNSKFPVDLKPYEDIKKSFKKKVKHRGELLYEKQ